MEILNAVTINQIIKRMSFEILERNFDSSHIYLAGINNNGYLFAKILSKELLKLTDKKIELVRITLNPANPISEEVNVEPDEKLMKNKPIIIIDDVANTGRTLFYAFKPFMDDLYKKIEVAVLVDRKHKSFPVKVDYLGISLATTLKEHIKVKLDKVRERTVELV
jgi:pyrimidine operon attenuation protein/uracil phosphoribosyltransferase